MRGVLYVTKMKRNLKYSVLEECMYQTTEGFMEVRIQHVTFSKVLKGGETLTHHARIITYADTRKYKLFSLLTNDMVHIPADTRSAFPVISVQSPVSIQCCWQS